MIHVRTFRLGLLAVLAAIYLSLAVTVALTAETPMKVSLCDVVKSMKQYNGKLIAVPAQYDSDGFENSGLSNPACRDTGLALSLQYSTKGVESLLAALHHGTPGTVDKLITATFIGVFHYDPKDSPYGMVIVQEIQDVTVRPIPENKTEPKIPLKVSLCTVVKNMEQYNGKLISIPVQYNSDGFENEGLTDPACKDTKLGIYMFGVKGVERLLDVVNNGVPGTLDKLVTATFIGVFHYDPREGPHGMLIVQGIQNVTVKPIPEDKTKPQRKSKSK